MDPALESNDMKGEQYPSPTGGQDSSSFYPRPDGQEQTDPSTDRQQHARDNIPSAEELQLAAQLSQGLSQSLPQGIDHEALLGQAGEDTALQVAIQQHEQDMQVHDQQASQHYLQEGSPMQQDQDLQQQQEHEQAMHHHDPHQHQYVAEHSPMQHQGQQYAPEHSPLQQHDVQQPAHQYVPDPQATSHGLPNFEQLAQQYAALPENTPPRKRSKVSRACDECRRKKVKCDAASENGEQACSNCRRSGVTCLFSRIPQKRGPSKGYIKELADRINSIEGKLANEGNSEMLAEIFQQSRRASSDPFAQGDEQTRKRPYSNISGDNFSTSNASRNQFQTPIDRNKPPFSANSLAPAASAPQSDPDTPSRPLAAMEGIADFDAASDGQVHEIDETAYQSYLTIVHQYCPFLSGNRARQQALLSQCPSSLRSAFIEAFYVAMQSFPSSMLHIPNSDVNAPFPLLSQWEADPSPRTAVSNLVGLQTLLLGIISTDNCGPSSVKGEHGGPAKATLLGRAIGYAYTMRLHVAKLQMDGMAGVDFDSDSVISIGAWWTLVLLDRWHSVGTASPPMIPNDTVVTQDSVRAAFGESVYYLSTLSEVLGHFASVAMIPSSDLLNAPPGTGRALSGFVNLSMEQFRLSLSPDLTPSTHPVIFLAYWHCRLLAYLFQTNAKSEDILWASNGLVEQLTGNPQLLSPINHHFFTLATLSLLELTKVDKTRVEAMAILTNLGSLAESEIASSPWDHAIQRIIKERVRPGITNGTSSVEATASQSLQHLADLATASEREHIKADGSATADLAPKMRTSEKYEDIGFDPTILTKGGYLNVLVESRPPTA